MSKILNKDNIDIVIYHHPCCDGFGSAYVVWKYYKLKNVDHKILYYPSGHYVNPPDIIGKNVLICDYSYKEEIMSDILKKCKSLLIIDHHVTAKNNLKNIPEENKILDMNHSGAMLTWKYFFNTDAPLLIKYIEDRDIWKKELPNTEEFATWFFTLPFEFEIYDKYYDNDKLIDDIKVNGKSYFELNRYYIDQAVLFSVPKFIKLDNKYYFVVFLNTTILKSDIGNQVFNKYPLADFSAMYSIKDDVNTTLFSLRSEDNRVDVSEIANLLGGGGHRNASGIRLNYVTNYFGHKYDDNNLYQILNRIYDKVIEINGKIYNVVYLNSHIYCTKLGAYLLQTRYVKDNKRFQNATEIKRIISKETIDTYYSISAVWFYNGMNNKTEYTISFDKELSKEDIQNISLRLKLNAGEHIVRLDGLQIYL